MSSKGIFTSILSYETIKLVTITNWRLGLIYRSIQLAVLLYIAIYAIWINKGYQKTSPIAGVLYTKVKGVAEDAAGAVFDACDLIVPPTEPLALFIATRSLQTLQEDNTFCYDPSTPCTNDTNCIGNTSDNGIIQPTCNTTAGYCVIKGWCPVEVDNPLAFNVFNGLQRWSVYLRSSITYSAFSISTDNAAKSAPGYNIFNLSSMLADANWTILTQNGSIIDVKIDWSCDLDYGVESCSPTYQYIVIGNNTGFNYRLATYIPNLTAPYYFPTRVYTKYYGLRFIFQIVGTGRKFDFATMIVTVGSAATFFSVASIVTDFIIQFFHPHKEEFDSFKRQYVTLEDEKIDTSFLAYDKKT